MLELPHAAGVGVIHIRQASYQLSCVHQPCFYILMESNHMLGEPHVATVLDYGNLVRISCIESAHCEFLLKNVLP